VSLSLAPLLDLNGERRGGPLNFAQRLPAQLLRRLPRRGHDQLGFPATPPVLP
jgi:hypothetical protein